MKYDNQKKNNQRKRILLIFLFISLTIIYFVTSINAVWWQNFYLNTTTSPSNLKVLYLKFDNDSLNGESYTSSNNLIYDYANLRNLTSYGSINYNPIGGFNESGAFEFNGINNYINQSVNIASFNNFTICMYYKSYKIDSVTRELLNNWESNGGYRFSFYSDDITFWIRNNTGSYDKIITTAKTSSTVIANKWTYICGRRNSDMNFSLFIDGIHYVSKTNLSGTIGSNSGKLVIGGSSTGGDVFNGTIDELTIWNRSLSDNEIQYLYGNPCNPLTGEDWEIRNNCTWISNMNNIGKTLTINNGTILRLENINLSIKKIVINNGGKLIRNGGKLILQ